jgi:hypothetical protein
MNSVAAFDDKTIAIGMLMESAQTQQRLAQEQLTHLHAHTQELDAVVRDEIRRTLVDEIKALHSEIAAATQAARQLKRAAGLRPALYGVLLACISGLTPLAIARWILPSTSQIAALQARRDQLTANLEALAQQGGRLELRRCGEARRLCARIDKSSARYGESGDFYVLYGY